jgi:hypothetical protein
LEAHYARLNRRGKCKQHSARPKPISLGIHDFARTYSVQYPDFQHSLGAAGAAALPHHTPRQTAILDFASLHPGHPLASTGAPRIGYFRIALLRFR